MLTDEQVAAKVFLNYGVAKYGEHVPDLARFSGTDVHKFLMIHGNGAFQNWREVYEPGRRAVTVTLGGVPGTTYSIHPGPRIASADPAAAGYELTCTA